ncbi:MAG: hypothetical protein WC915_01515 [archaeon]|jgi:hypothetical protein
MEETILIKGVALFSALAGLQQWLVQNITPFDIFFIVLIVAFLISVERDYLKYKYRQTITGEPSLPLSNQFFLRTA